MKKDIFEPIEKTHIEVSPKHEHDREYFEMLKKQALPYRVVTAKNYPEGTAYSVEWNLPEGTFMPIEIDKDLDCQMKGYWYVYFNLSSVYADIKKFRTVEAAVQFAFNWRKKWLKQQLNIKF